MRPTTGGGTLNVHERAYAGPADQGAMAEVAQADAGENHPGTLPAICIP